MGEWGNGRVEHQYPSPQFTLLQFPNALLPHPLLLEAA